MIPNKPDGPGFWYKAFLNKRDDPDFDWRIVQLKATQDNRLAWSDGLGWHYPDAETNTYWERVPPPSWERTDARAGATTDEVTT